MTVCHKYCSSVCRNRTCALIQCRIHLIIAHGLRPAIIIIISYRSKKIFIWFIPYIYSSGKYKFIFQNTYRRKIFILRTIKGSYWPGIKRDVHANCTKKAGIYDHFIDLFYLIFIPRIQIQITFEIVNSLIIFLQLHINKSNIER